MKEVKGLLENYFHPCFWAWQR